MIEAGARIVMPKLGLTMAEGLLAEWLVKAGDEVAEGQILFVVETDKISNEVEAPAPGRILSLLVAEGDTVEVGTPVALWTGPGQSVTEAVDGVPASAEPKVVTAEPAMEASIAAGERIRSTPFARRLAKHEGIAVESCAGTGPRGRIQARDVRAALEKVTVPAAVLQRRDLRSLIAARVSRSWAEIPHFSVSADAAFDALDVVRRDLNADPLSLGKLSVTVFLVAAVARALQLEPEMNRVWRDGRAKALTGVGIGIAIATPSGVVAPVLPVAAGDSLYLIAEKLERAIERARRRRLRAENAGEAAGGISNVGMLGVRALVPIIDPDQTFMLGVGTPRSTFRPDVTGTPQALNEVTLSLACDHRVVDGALAARFLAAIVQLLEHPARLTIPFD